MGKNTGAITISIQGDTPDDLKRMVNTLAEAFGGADAFVDRVADIATTGDDQTPARADVTLTGPATEKPEKERPEKEQEPEGEAHEGVEAGAVKDMEPAEMREKGISLMMQHMAADKSGKARDDLSKLQKKFGVKLFKDISDDQAEAFLMDARMIANGTAEVA